MTTLEDLVVTAAHFYRPKAQAPFCLTLFGSPISVFTLYCKMKAGSVRNICKSSQ